MKANCSTHHSPPYITMQPPLSVDTWAAEVRKIEKTYGADISDDATPKIIPYLHSRPATETRKH
jgi:hypothetical protein